MAGLVYPETVGVASSLWSTTGICSLASNVSVCTYLRQCQGTRLENCGLEKTRDHKLHCHLEMVSLVLRGYYVSRSSGQPVPKNIIH